MGFYRKYIGFFNRNQSSFLFYILNMLVVIFGPLYLAVFWAGIFGFFFYPQWKSKFDLFFTETEENRKRIENCPSIKSVFFLKNFNKTIYFTIKIAIRDTFIQPCGWDTGFCRLFSGESPNIRIKTFILQEKSSLFRKMDILH